METIRLTSRNVRSAAAAAAEVLRNGGVILYPTDTLYGLGADARSDSAVAKMRAAKGRANGKPIHAIFLDLEEVEKYARVNNDARILAKRFLPGPLTLVLPKKKGNGEGIMRNVVTLGVRIPRSEFCRALAEEFGEPYTTTSANKTGKKPARDVQEILTSFGKAASGIDLVIDAGEIPQSEPSTVVDMSGKRPIILREGAIPAADIWDELGAEMQE